VPSLRPVLPPCQGVFGQPDQNHPLCTFFGCGFPFFPPPFLSTTLSPAGALPVYRGRAGLACLMFLYGVLSVARSTLSPPLLRPAGVCFLGGMTEPGLAWHRESLPLPGRNFVCSLSPWSPPVFRSPSVITFYLFCRSCPGLVSFQPLTELLIYTVHSFRCSLIVSCPF